MLPGLFWYLSLAFTLFCAFDVLLSSPVMVRSRTRTFWLVVVLLPAIGGLLWLRSGRPIGAGRMPGSLRATAIPAFSASTVHGGVPRGPDDDADFINALAERLRRQDPGT